jgi:hypothetical protein
MIKKIFLLFLLYYTSAKNTDRINYQINNTKIEYKKKGIIGLAGFTPHPTEYIKKNINNIENIDFDAINIEKIIDIEYFKESVEKKIICCKKNNINLLIVAFLPVYYTEMIKILGLKKSQYIYEEFNRVYLPIIFNFYKNISKKLNYLGEIIISIPPSDFLKDLPSKSLSDEERGCFLISQFPTLNFSENEEYTILVINSFPSSEDRNIIKNLQKKHPTNNFFYKIDHINKNKFYKYI